MAPTMKTPDSVAKFDGSRAAEYETQSRIALAGYDACHELSACLLSAHLGAGARTVLVAGAGGTGQEILTTARLEPQWSFVAADPSPPMLNLAGVLHHIPDPQDKAALLRSLADRLPPHAPLVVACNRCPYETQPLFLQAWARRWRMAGASESEIGAKLGKILQGAVPPESEAEVESMLAKAGFVRPLRFFSSLFWSAWIVFRQEG